MTPPWKQLPLRIDDASQVASTRRAASDLAHRLGFDETHVGKAALLATEAATNILKHAGNGEILVRSLDAGAGSSKTMPGIEIVAIDRGPGISRLNESMMDGMSTTGTAGTGLGAMKRLADDFRIHTQADKGTVVCMRLWQDGRMPENASVSAGSVCVPMPGETECGDAWACIADETGATLLVADGLGHGPEAAAAADAAVEAFIASPAARPAHLLENAHGALRATRGAAVSFARIDRKLATVTCAGVGNIAATVLHAGGRRQLVSHSGIVGSNVRKIQEFTLPFSPGDVLILHSDGLASQWSMDAYPGLLSYEPSIIASVLYRDFWRRRDDVTVVAVQ